MNQERFDGLARGLATNRLSLFGAKRIPELARSLGRGKREFHKAASERKETGHRAG
jgi:TatA/E family protein of Tat protein translocase